MKRKKIKILTVIAASVCMYWMSLPRKPSSLLALPTEETTPTVMVFDRDNGDPRAATNSPGRKSLDFPREIDFKSFCKKKKGF